MTQAITDIFVDKMFKRLAEVDNIYGAKSTDDIIKFHEKYSSSLYSGIGGFYVNHKLEYYSNRRIFDSGKDIVFINIPEIKALMDKGLANTDVVKTLLHETCHMLGREDKLNRPYVADLNKRNWYSAAEEEALAEIVAFETWKQLPFYKPNEGIESFSKYYIETNIAAAKLNPDFDQEKMQKNIENLFKMLKYSYIMPIIKEIC